MKRLIISICFLLPIFLMAQSNSDNKILPFDPAVRKGKLTNGFTYYIRRNTEPHKRVIFYLANKVGSILEDEDQRGLAHFMEHMSFNGTTHFPKNSLVDYLQKTGVRFGADLNAYTSFDETVYQLPVPSDNPEIVKNGLQIMRDWAHGATLDPVEIDKERGVVLEEKRLGKGAGERVQRKVFPVILNGSKYANRVPIGIDEVLNNFKPETIRRFYEDWYRPDLQALIVVGDIDTDQIEQQVKAMFGDLKNPTHERPRLKYTTPLTGKNNFIIVTDKELTTTSASIIIKHKASQLKTEAEYRNTLVTQLFNAILAQRYAGLQRQANPPFISASAHEGPLLGGLDNFEVIVNARSGGLENGVKAAWQEIERVKRYGFTAGELERAKSNLSGRLESSYTEREKTSSSKYVSEYLQYFLKGIASPGIAFEYPLMKKLIEEIKLNDVNNLAGNLITVNNRDIIITAPQSDAANLPTEATFKTWITGVETEKIEPAADRSSNLSLLSSKPLSGQILSETKNAKNGLTTIIFKNGLKVILKPTDFKNDQIIFTAFAPGGTSLYSDTDFQSASAAAVITAAGGVGNYNKADLIKYLAGKQVNVSPYISENAQGFNGGFSRQNIDNALQLIYGYYTEPRKDREIFNNLIVQTKAALANRENDPKSVFIDTVSAFLGNNNIRRTGPSIAKIDQINLDRALDIYKDRFADASEFTFVFVGSFTVEELKPFLEKYLGGLPAINRNEKARDLHIHPPAGVYKKIVYRGTEAQATVQLVYSGKFDYNEPNNLKIQALKECLQIRLIERLRENESGAYSPGVNISTTKRPEGRYAMVVRFGCAPQNADKLIASAVDEINKLKTEGPPQVNVDKFKAEDRLQRETQMTSNTFWLAYLSSQLQNQEDLDNGINDYGKAIDNITPAMVKEVAQKYLVGDNLITFELLPVSTKP